MEEIKREPEPVPGLDPNSGERQPLLHRLHVNGETFEVRDSQGGGFDYDWITGPNTGYGFGSSGQADMSEAQHRENVVAFLSMIDPETGFIGATT